VLARALILLCLCLLACWPQWCLPELHGTEGRRIQIALEMAQRGDWLVPTLGGQPTWAKPPLHYWLLGGLSEWFGASTWVMRLPSVVGLWAAALLAMELLRRWFGSRTGWIGAFGVLLSPIVLVEFPTAEIDPLFASLTAMSLWCLATGVGREQRSMVLWSGILGGLAMLQKGPPYFMLAGGAYLVWWRRRGLRFALSHFVPLIALPLAYYVPLWLLRVAPDEMFAVVNEETLGRIATFQWEHITSTPAFWVRAVAVQMPFVMWCFWEWRGARDARMDPADLTLRMCSGAAVFAIVVLTFFPGRPTRYLLPNVLLFTFAVSPAVAHFFGQERVLGAFSRRGLRVVGVLGAVALLAIPFLGRQVPMASLGLALVAALGPTLVYTPRQLVGYCLILPLVMAWTVVLDRSLSWPDSGRSRSAAGVILRREMERLGAVEDFVTQGHIDAPFVLAAGLLPNGDEFARANPTTKWLLHEAADDPVRMPKEYVERLRICVPGEIFAVREREGGAPK
jgi:4-amino-4-deoxy-L-arabinose transferase-like glycosyltransferase